MMELNAVKHPQKRRRTEMPRALSGKDCWYLLIWLIWSCSCFNTNN
jgi:hypothetical protein